MDVEYKDRHLLNNAAEVKLGSATKASILMTIANADKLYTIDMEHEDFILLAMVFLKRRVQN